MRVSVVFGIVSEVEASCSAASALRSGGRVRSHHAPTRLLATGHILFQVGDTHADLYRVERGALCHYIRWDDGRHEVIECAFLGDIIGFGNLEAHISTARAMVETEVSLVAEHDFQRALDTDGHLAARVTAAADREFDYVRAQAVKAGAGRPAVRLASYLAVLSHMSASEGRDPTLLPDEIASGLAAERLHMSIDCLFRALLELECRGLVAPLAVGGPRIIDMTALEKFADAA
jgi:CRP/FNR family transcriptional regulator, anaerobic regulatory protein